MEKNNGRFKILHKEFDQQKHVYWARVVDNNEQDAFLVGASSEYLCDNYGNGDEEQKFDHRIESIEKPTPFIAFANSEDGKRRIIELLKSKK